MAKYYIPDAIKAGFANILSLTDTEMHILIEKMKGFSIGDSPDDFQILMNGVNIPNIEEIARTIVSFSGLLVENKDSIEQLAEGLVSSYILENEENISTLDQQQVVSNLVRIFNQSSILKLTYKIYTLSSEVQFQFRNSQIITDIRLIFNDEVEQSNRNAVITQQLKIEYLKNSDISELFINLDRDDLLSLKEQIERALKKEDVIRSDYNSMINFVQLKN